ncbi:MULTISPECIES: TadA family conjugal transfer-associated ATPase [Kytococcus]|uniref:Pilus assembly protein CpaF n=1 Tax=Kytococcus schroeteri TaxID=138300 RepID=A0A2I1PC44_9MICO|nr:MULTISPECIES: TadA family conjugal transfer-associated ATPase [Kytococcus]OFS11073.1 pilus assembly protein CpaF [Kytococcus sp. HMSC28H12]PKZ42202.1 pilus assembly protein CpaF [Kytococcus schroeteri]
MSAPSSIREQISRGRAPSERTVGEVAGAQRLRLGDRGVRERSQRLGRSVLGAGPLEPVLAEPGVTDVLVNGTDGVWVDRGRGLERDATPMGSAEDLRQLAVRLAGLAGRRLDDTAPCVDGLLPGGIRLHAVLPPLVDGAAHLSLRVPREVVPSVEEMLRLGTLDELGARVVRDLVARRLAFVVSGGTGSGKTTLLATLLSLVDPADRILVVEDVRELAVQHPHVVRMQSRSANVEGRGAIDMTHLVKQSLRMRPDRVVVGEVRGPEMRELLAALNTGHEGGCGTVHANAIEDVVARFEALGALADMTPQAVHAQLGSALDCVLHVRRLPERRVLAQVGVLVTGDDGRVRCLPAMDFRDGALRPAAAWERLEALLGWSS